MMREAPDYPSIEKRLARDGLMARGGFRAGERDDDIPGLPDGGRPKAIVLVGNAGAGMWHKFTKSQEYTERQPHALDRWTTRVLGHAARDLGAEVRFPFEGPPYLPFLTWAERAEPVFVSPLGMLIHPDYGLWHAYRGALLFSHVPGGLPCLAQRSHPCEACNGKPCLSACPVDAFKATGQNPPKPVKYDVNGCKEHISAAQGRACLTQGCAARRACPVGREWTYGAPQAEFHMRAFLGSAGREMGSPARRGER
jgi:hypothetical protein